MRSLVVWLTHRHVACFDFSDSDLAALQARLPEVKIRLARDEKSFRAALPEAEIALVWRFEQEMFALAPHLRWIATPAAGRDYFRITPPAGVRLTYGTFHGELMGETALGMILGASRGLFTTLATQREALWPNSTVSRTMRPLRGSHLVILGFGNIGQWVGRLAKGFGMRVTGVKQRPAQIPEGFGKEDRVVGLTELDAVLPTADHLLLALPSGSATDRLIDARRLALLQNHAWIYNLGRGNAIAEEPLADALTAGGLAGACLDVYRAEPLPADSPLRRAPNVLLMPHVSACAPNYMRLFIEEFVSLYYPFATEC